MNRTEFATLLMAEMKDADGTVITEALWLGFIDAGVRFFSNYRPLSKRATLDLVADQSEYARPTDFLDLKEVEWGASRRRFSSSTHPAAWDANFEKVDLPRFRQNGNKIYLDPAPTAAQITQFTATYAYWYKAAHVVDDDGSTVPVHDDPIVMQFAKWCAYETLAGEPGQPEEFVVRYRKMAEQVWAVIEKLLKPAPAIVR